MTRVQYGVRDFLREPEGLTGFGQAQGDAARGVRGIHDRPVRGWRRGRRWRLTGGRWRSGWCWRGRVGCAAEGTIWRCGAANDRAAPAGLASGDAAAESECVWLRISVPR